MRRHLRAGPLLPGGLALLGRLALVWLLLAGLSPLPSAGARAASAGPASAGCEPSRLNVSEALAGGRVTVSPGPGTRDASSATQISMLGVPAAELQGVTVAGSRSGRHAGRLAAYSLRDGASFLPARPFDAGELVSVHADILEGGRTVPFGWSFTVAVGDSAGAESTAVGTGTSPRSGPAPAPREYQSFHSSPSLRPPIVTVSPNAQTASGDVFLAPYSGVGQYGPMILNENGGLIWFKPLSPAGARAADFRVQQYEGRPVLTWWQDPLVANGLAAAGDVIANSSYQTIAEIRAGNGYQPDLHEFQITPQGTALITIYDAIDCNLSSVGGSSRGAVADTLMQELDLRTGLVMYEWHSLDHVPLQNSYSSAAHTSRAEPFDYFHINSVDVEQDGDLLIDSRNTWAAYDVNPETGQVRWELGGRRSNFKMGPGAATAWQHDAREQPNGSITFFDNGAFPKAHSQSRAIEVALDPATMTATLVRSYEHVNPLVSGSQGNVQALPNGDWMVGWGQAGYLSEVNAQGQPLFNAHLPPDWESYRTYALAWSGQPAEPPAVAYVPAPGAHPGGVLYASWNGATDVASWRVLAGSTPATLTPLASTPRTGFETAISLPASVAGENLAVQALDGSGAVLGSSPAVRAPA